MICSRQKEIKLYSQVGRKSAALLAELVHSVQEYKSLYRANENSEKKSRGALKILSGVKNDRAGFEPLASG